MSEMHEHNTEPTREDVIIGRIVDGEASPSDWHDLDRIAEKDASVWQRLAQAQRAHARLERVVEDEIAVAELVSLPLHRERAVYHFMSRLRAYGGWAVAAVLTLALIGAYNPLSRGPRLTAGPGGVSLSEATPDEAYDRYLKAGLQDGRVMGVMPNLLIDAKDLDGVSGGEMVIVRRILERVSVKDAPFYALQSNEFGEPALMPVRVRAGGAGESGGAGEGGAGTSETPKAAQGVGY